MLELYTFFKSFFSAIINPEEKLNIDSGLSQLREISTISYFNLEIVFFQPHSESTLGNRAHSLDVDNYYVSDELL